MSPPHLQPPLFLLWTLVAFFLSFLTLHSASTSATGSTILVKGSSTIISENGTFRLGFFNTNGNSNWYLGVWYSSVPTPTYVWVANREHPTRNLDTSSFVLAGSGRLSVKQSENVTVWESTNTEFSTEARFLDNGNLVLLTREGTVSWQSFDHPTDTWLPGMNLTKDRFLTSWRSFSDPSPGLYSLRLKPADFGGFQLVHNATEVYWSTGNWTGETFANVPEMTIPYIYQLSFVDPFTPTASFGFTLRPLDTGLIPPLSRFKMDYRGQLQQYTWSPQTEHWDMFWSQPESVCRVYGLCGSFGLCNSSGVRPCECLPLPGFEPVNHEAWESEDYSSGCRRESESSCEENDQFEGVSAVRFDGAVRRSFSSDRKGCESACLEDCACFGLYYDVSGSLCKNLYGSLLNLRNISDSVDGEEVLYVRVARGGRREEKRKIFHLLSLAIGITGSVLVLGFIGVVLMVLLGRRRKSREGVDEDGGFPILNLKVFSYKELHLATRSFSEKLGHGGFGTVFQGVMSDSSTIVAVKRLERPGGGEREFRAEVCTIGNIQHLNLVRLRGFCSESSHRLLVYDYMPNGPLSAYLRREGPNLSWDVRFRVAVGTARGIAYLHEECRDCIIHCDIKPENILLDSEFTAKVSDFGLAKLIGRDFSRVLATMRGTWGYVAPEWISGVEITTKADVYSFGMTLLELIGGRRNVEAPPSSAKGGGAGVGEKWFFPPWAAQQIIEGNLVAVIDSRLGGAYDTEQAKRVGLVAVWCIQDDEAMRPGMGMVVKMLDGVVEVTVPPAPKLLQALVSGESFCGVRADSSNGVSSGSGFYGDNMAVVSSGGSESCLGNVPSPANENVNALPKSLTDLGY